MSNVPSFRVWLMGYFYEDSARGDLARDMRADVQCGCLAKEVYRYPSIRRHMQRVHGIAEHEPAMQALDQAYADYQQEVRV